MENKNLFPDVIGQESAKKQISFYLRGYHNNRVLQTLFFAGCRGSGKTLLAKETAKNLYLYNPDGSIVYKEDGVTPKKKPFITINAASIKNVRQFISDYFVPHIVDKDVSCLIDEVHALKPDVTNFLLTILNPNPTNRNSFEMDGYNVEVNFAQQSFLLASSEPHLVFMPLLDRTTRINLAAYSDNELGRILQKSLPDVTFVYGVLDEIATVLRQSARCAVQMAQNVNTFLSSQKKNQFDLSDWKVLKSELAILPHGVSDVELSLLRIMKRCPQGCSLVSLSAKSGLSGQAIMRDFESHLQRLNFMRVEAGRGRVLTNLGIEFLRLVDNVV